MSKVIKEDWKIKIVLPIMYFLGALTLFYFVSSSNGFVLSNVEVIGISISFASFILWIISRIQLGNSFSVDPRATRLVKTGIYSKIRHPVYIFSFSAIFGIFVFLQNWILFLLLIPLFILQIFRISKEEEILTKKFGSEYSQYKYNTWF